MTGGQTEAEGRVEYCSGGVWGSVCDNTWDAVDASVICNQLGFTSVGEFLLYITDDSSIRNSSLQEPHPSTMLSLVREQDLSLSTQLRVLAVLRTLVSVPSQHHPLALTPMMLA